MSPAELLREFEAALDELLATRYAGDDVVSLAARYVLTNGGKRVRPVLCLLAAGEVGGTRGPGVAADTVTTPVRRALPAALALECVHTYSLVHDDLPCMDDDDLRRGKPTAHKVYGEANALLAGDALLTDAFALLADAALPPDTRIALVRELADAAGGAGMVRGQALDLHWTARTGATRAALDDIHLRKTGYLLGAAASMGALAGGADAATAARYRAFGRALGLAFQVLDDLLDDTAATGKTAGKDKAAGKLTYLALMSRDDARAAAAAHTRAALDALGPQVPAASPLVAYARALLERTH